MRAILDQRDKADLWKSAAAAARSGPAEGLLILRLVCNIQCASVQADQSIFSIPGSPGRPRRDRLHHLVVQLTHRFPSEPGARLRDARLAGDFDRLRWGEQP